MNREEALTKSDEALKELSEALQQGKSQELIKYLDFCSRLHKYSFGNCMLIAVQFPTASMVAGFNRWKELGRFVKKGEKGISILAPLINRKKKIEPTPRDGEEPETQSGTYIKGFRVVHVFDVSQTEGQELPTLASQQGDPGTALASLETLIRSKGIELIYESDLGGAFGLSQGQKISVLTDLSPAQTFSILAHELAHELLHRGDRREQTTKSIRETEAEAVAYVVCRAIGLPSSNGSADYIQLWNGDLSLLAKSLELIRDVSAHIISQLEVMSSQEVSHVA